MMKFLIQMKEIIEITISTSIKYAPYMKIEEYTQDYSNNNTSI